MAVNIILPQIVMNSANRNSGIAIGENQQTNWHAHSKNNFGEGTFFGISLTPFNVNIIIDNDVVDTPMTEAVPNVTAQNQTL